MNKLVSIITPCYNGEHYVHRFMDSILSQTYDSIELIFVNDGSVDRTEDVVLSFQEKFKEKGIRFKYIYQKNKGLGGAINTGLKQVTGSYLCWPDSDDYLEPKSVEKRVQILNTHPEYAVVTSDAYIRDINFLDQKPRILASNDLNKFKENQFDLLLAGESIFCSGTHMMRMSVFLETHPNGQIYPCRRGQNWQLLLPVYYKYKRYFLDEPLYNYIIYNSSMSQGDNTEENKIYRSKEHEQILINTISSMAMDLVKKQKYILQIRERYTRKNMTIAFDFGNKKLFFEQYKKLKSITKISLKDFILMLVLKTPKFIHKGLYKLFKILRT